MASIHRAVAFLILGIGALLTSSYLFLNESSIDASKIFDVRFLDTLPSGFFSKYVGDEEYIRAYLEFNGSFDGVFYYDVREVSIFIDSNDINIRLGDDLLYSKNNVSIVNYTGKINYKDGNLEMKGRYLKIFSPYYVIVPEKRERIEYNGTVASLKIAGFEVKKSVFEDFNGIVIIKAKGDKISYEVNNKDLEIERIKGEIIIRDNEILFKGEGVIKTEVVLTPLINK